MMAIIAFILLIISLSKLLLVISSNNQLEVKELVHNIPILVNIPPPILLASIITIDGFISLICSLFILTIIL